MSDHCIRIRCAGHRFLVVAKVYPRSWRERRISSMAENVATSLLEESGPGGWILVTDPEEGRDWAAFRDGESIPTQEWLKDECFEWDSTRECWSRAIVERPRRES